MRHATSQPCLAGVFVPLLPPPEKVVPGLSKTPFWDKGHKAVSEHTLGIGLAPRFNPPCLHSKAKGFARRWKLI